ncbi:hypothetical protein ONE63_010906 [Megalurothrips usitatus]|uniref:PX domain-containing protein kinase-like protein n=1 Tax=Megalurothrips usitatus TaxID=439358 RepID=A0AAV7XHE3_9NEOP|nr:hypothetical protein ONE63_010906 [Megalurothrips usitatus]
MAVFERKVQLRSQLDDTDVLACTVEASHNIQGHTEYSIRVQRGPHPGKCWHINKRFRDFVNLNSLLGMYGVSLPLPPKKFIGNMDPLFIAERQIGLQNYLNVLQENPFLATSFPVRQFLDPDHYPPSIHENALHSVSLALRGEPIWEVLKPLPELGWRIRKHYFLIKKHTPHQEDQELLLNWTEYGPDMNVQVSQLQSTLSVLSTLKEPVAVNIEFLRCNEIGCLVVRPFIEAGTLRDALCGCKARVPVLRKYVSLKQYFPLAGDKIAAVACQILQNLAVLHYKGIPYGQLHTGNVCVSNRHVSLLDIEGGLLGVPSLYRPYVVQHRRLDTIQSVDMYSFGHVLYEMAFGSPLRKSSVETLPSSCCQSLADVLEQLLSPRALREGLPTAQQLLQHEFFGRIDVAKILAEYRTFKFPGHTKEVLKSVTLKIEERLRHDQKIVHHQRRLAKVQEMLSSEEEKKRRKQKWKEKEKERQLQHKQSQQQMVNGKSPERSDSPASTSTATSAGTVTPPFGRSDSRLTSVTSSAPPPPVTPVPTPGSVPPPPPPPSALPSPVVVPERAALLTSISAFNKSSLRQIKSPR